MITTSDVKIKRRGDKKLTIISTDYVQPRGFNVKGKPKPHDGVIITTENVEAEKKRRERAEKRKKK